MMTKYERIYTKPGDELIFLPPLNDDKYDAVRHHAGRVTLIRYHETGAGLAAFVRTASGTEMFTDVESLHRFRW